MSDTPNQVHQFMLKFQKEHSKPPTLQDIQEAVGTLNWKSSARHTLETMVADGRVTVDGGEGESRRYHAVDLPAVAPIKQLWPFDDKNMFVTPVTKANFE